LSDPLVQTTLDRLRTNLATLFAPVMAAPTPIADIALFVEPAPGDSLCQPDDSLWPVANSTRSFRLLASIPLQDETAVAAPTNNFHFRKPLSKDSACDCNSSLGCVGRRNICRIPLGTLTQAIAAITSVYNRY
jgi:hypothetical protein